MKLPTLLSLLLIVFSGFVSCKTLKKQTGKSDQANEIILTENEWKLVKLEGRWISETNSKPFIVFEKNENRIRGNTGCNNFFGTYELRNTQKIGFSQIGMTKKACIGNTVETPFIKTLELTAEYKIKADTLLFLNDSGAILAHFSKEIKIE